MLIPRELRERQDRAKAIAKRIGLSNWSAIAYGPNINPRAYAIAERVWRKSPVRKERYDYMPLWSSVCGLDANKVAEYWLAAGRKDGRKFRAQVTYNRKAGRSESVSQFIRRMEAERWLEEAKLSVLISLHRKAASALARISPELRWAALFDVHQATNPLDARHPVRLSELNWAAVRRAVEAKRAGHMRVYAALAYPKAVMQELGLQDMRALVAYICPAYPRMAYEKARRIALGMSPVDLTGGLLTRREAHEWALEGGTDHIHWWLADRLGVPIHRSVRVVRWLGHCKSSGRWDAVTRKRQMHVAGHNGPRTCSLLDVLDEIQGEDIVTGRDSVVDVMRRASERMRASWRERFANDTKPLAPVPSWAMHLPRGIRLLNTTSELVAEGVEMEHCVDTYINAVSREECHILSICTKDGRSTAELSGRTLQVLQHRGPRNTHPPMRNAQMLQEFLALLQNRS